MRFLKLMLVLPVLALSASPTYAAHHRAKRHHMMMRHSVNGPTSVMNNSGKRGNTMTGGPSGGASVH